MQKSINACHIGVPPLFVPVILYTAGIQRRYHRENRTRRRFSQSCHTFVAFLKKHREEWEGLGSEWRNSCYAHGSRDAVNGTGEKASEIKRPVDGLFSRAVMYDCSLEEWTPSLRSSSFFSTQALPSPSFLPLLSERWRGRRICYGGQDNSSVIKNWIEVGDMLRIFHVVNVYLP